MKKYLHVASKPLEKKNIENGFCQVNTCVLAMLEMSPPLGLHGFFKHWDFVVKKADKQNYTREHFLPRLENVQKSRFVGGVRYGTA